MHYEGNKGKSFNEPSVKNNYNEGWKNTFVESLEVWYGDVKGNGIKLKLMVK